MAHLPGIVRASIAMPDIHWGYGFPIGGVAGMDAEEGVISPGGVGYDINCGVRLLRSSLEPRRAAATRWRQLVDALFRNIPTGVGCGAARPAARPRRPARRAAARRGVGGRARASASRATSTRIEEGGCFAGADPAQVSDRALERGARPARHARARATTSSRSSTSTRSTTRLRRARSASQLDTVTVMIHSGSRGLGHQVCDDSPRDHGRTASRRTASSCPTASSAARRSARPRASATSRAMAAAANFAFANRQVMTPLGARELRRGAAALGATRARPRRRLRRLPQHREVRDASTSTAQRRRVCVHRKGATRAFPPGHPEVPAALPRGRPAGADPGRHGALLVRARRHRSAPMTRPSARPATAPAGA